MFIIIQESTQAYSIKTEMSISNSMLEYQDKIINSGRFALEEELNSTWKKIEKKKFIQNGGTEFYFIFNSRKYGWDGIILFLSG